MSADSISLIPPFECTQHWSEGHNYINYQGQLISAPYITELKLNEVFVFGSNEAGRHGAGAALLAVREFGAKYGVGVGLMGQSYAIPTKDAVLKTLPIARIHAYVLRFLRDAEQYSKYTFLVTEIGCGLAGLQPREIAPMFFKAGPNIALPWSFYRYKILARNLF